MQPSRRYLATESSQSAGLVGARSLRRVKGSGSLSVRIPESEAASSQATAPSTRSPPIQMNQSYLVPESPVLPQSFTEGSETSGDYRRTSVVGGFIHVPTVAPSQHQVQVPRSSPPVIQKNVLRKTPPLTRRPSAKKGTSFARWKRSKLGRSRSNSKRPVISQPSDPVHVSGHSTYTKPLVRTPEFVPEETRTAEPAASAPEPEGDAEIRQPSLPLRCHPFNIDVILTPAPDQPRSPNPSITSRKHSRRSNLTVSHSWRAAYDREHNQAIRLHTRMKMTEANLTQERARADHLEREYNRLLAETADPRLATDAKLSVQALASLKKVKEVESRCADLEKEMILQRAESNQNRKYADHYRMLYEREVAKTESLQRQLNLQSQTEDSTQSSPAAGTPAPTSDSIHELSATVSHEILRAPDPINQEQDETVTTHELSTISWLESLRVPSTNCQVEAGSVETHELSATASHEILRPSPEEEQSSVSSYSEINELPYSIPELAFLCSGFKNLFAGAGASESDETVIHRDLDEVPPSPTCSELAALHDLASEEEEAEEQAGVRPEEAIYRFGSPKIEAAPAVYRVSISWSAVVYTPPSPIAVAVLRMDSWEWCSIPDLKLTDPRD